MKDKNKGYIVNLPRWVDRCPSYFKNFDNYCVENDIESIVEGLRLHYNVKVNGRTEPIQPDEIECVFESEEDFIMFKLKWA